MVNWLFFSLLNKMPKTNNSKKGLFCSPFEGAPTNVAGKSWRPEHEAAGHTVSTAQNQRGVNAKIHAVTFSHHSTQGLSPQGSAEQVFPSQLNMYGNTVTDTPRGVSPLWFQIQSNWQWSLIIKNNSKTTMTSFFYFWTREMKSAHPSSTVHVTFSFHETMNIPSSKFHHDRSLEVHGTEVHKWLTSHPDHLVRCWTLMSHKISAYFSLVLAYF